MRKLGLLHGSQDPLLYQMYMQKMHPQYLSAGFTQDYSTCHPFLPTLCFSCHHYNDLAQGQEAKRLLFLKSYQVSPSLFPVPSPPPISSSPTSRFPSHLLPLHCILIMIISGAVGGFKGVAPLCFNSYLGCPFAL